MVQVATPFKQLNEQEQAVYFYARSRSLSFRVPSAGLFGTHRFTGSTSIPVATIDTSESFPDLDRPITLSTEIEITGASATGLIWEFGSSAQGAKLAIDGGSLFLAAGDDAGDDGVDGELALASLGVTGARLLLTVAISPGRGSARLWVDAQIGLRLNADPMLNNSWTDSADGSLGSDQAGTSTQRGQTINSAPSDFILVRPLDVFQGQIPRHFDA